MQLGKKIRDLRLRRGLTVQQLGEATGLSKGFISQVENSRTSPSLATLQDLARALETSVAYLVVEEERIRPAGSEVETLLSDPSRARDLMGWTPQVDLETGLRRTADWIAENVDLAKAHRYHR